MMVNRISLWLGLTLIIATACHRTPTSSSEFTTERQKMVEQQLKPRGIPKLKIPEASVTVGIGQGKLHGEGHERSGVVGTNRMAARERCDPRIAGCGVQLAERRAP